MLAVVQPTLTPVFVEPGTTLRAKILSHLDRRFTVTLPCGTKRTIMPGPDGYWIPEQSRHGIVTLHAAIRWCLRDSRATYAPLDNDADRLHAIASSVERADGKTVCATLKTLLHKRTGHTWSVTLPARSMFVRISAPPSRMVDGEMSFDDQLALRAALGDEVTAQGVMVPSTRGHRGSFVFRIAGVPIPSTWKLSEHDWD